MNPIQITKEIQEALANQANYLRPVQEHFDKEAESTTLCLPEFDKAVKSYPFCKKLFIERIPFYTQDTRSFQALVNAHIIEEETARTFAKFFSCNNLSDFHPYTHQVSSIENVKDGNNLIVCTGTGSGKTECFLMPIIDSIIRERKEKGASYKKGIRALIIYPMNALVNDQVQRIRRLILGACKNDVPYAKDITYGIYTGDLQNYETRRLGTQLDLPEQDALYRSAKHDNMASEEIPDNEYKSRAQWQKDGADIIITNYVMLERLLLDPGKSSMFNNETWRFIVLDEAHTYDGGLGTDISWLIKRVVQRCGKEPKDFRFIATTATLLDNDNGDKEAIIKNTFASKIFPAPAKTFSVQFGKTMELPQVEGKRSIPWHKVKAECGDDIKEYTKQVDKLLCQFNREQDIKLRDGLRNIFIPNEETKSDIITFTQWYKDLESWMDSWEFIANEDNGHIANIVDEKQPLSDTIYVANLLCMLDSDYILPIKADEVGIGLFRNFYAASIDKQKKSTQKLSNHPRPKKKRVTLENLLNNIVSIYEENNPQRKEQIRESIKNFLEGKSNTITAEGLLVVVHFVQEAAKKPTSNGEKQESLRVLENLLIRWESEASLRLLGKTIADLREIHKTSLHQAITLMWQNAIRSLDIECVGDDYGRIITEAVREDTLFLNLNKKLSSPWVCYNKGIWDDLCKREEFEMLTRILPLTKHNVLRGKPLLDLRFHLLVSGISGAAVYFTRDNGKIKSNFIFDDQDNFENDLHEETYSPLFTLGVCHTCGHPYILVYQEVEDDEVNEAYPAYAMRYGDEKRNNKPSIYTAYTWLKGDHPAEEYDDDAGKEPKIKSRYWLNYEEGKIYENDDCPGDSYLELFHISQAEEMTLNIRACHACGTMLRTNSDDEYGLIAPYSTGAVKDRTNILTTLARNMDSSLYCKGSIAGGKKLLAFSDSRAGAASLALDLDGEIEELLVKQFIEDIIEDESIGNINSFFATLKNNWMRFDNALTSKFQTWVEDNEMPTSIDSKLTHWNKELDYPHTLMRILLPLQTKLQSSEASSLLQKEYRDSTSSSQMFSDLSAASLIALGALRSNRRHGLVRSERVQTYSYKHSRNNEDKKYWNEYAEIFKYEDDAEAFFDTVYRILFLDSELDCEIYDRKCGKNYRMESDKLVDGYSSGMWSKKRFYKFEGCDDNDRALGMRSVFNAYGRPTKFQRILKEKYEINESAEQRTVLNQLWMYLLECDIITPVNVSYDEKKCEIKIEKREGAKKPEIDIKFPCRLNLNDVRFKKGNARSVNEDRREEQYYRVEEHTAQLSTAKARIHQNLFSSGKINILSCSTTYEMGVDLGELNCVFLSNLPPSVANYKQRAGRAGRRAGSASLVVTYLGKSGHDQSSRNNPEKLMFGRMKSPTIYADNVSYRSKHFRAEALAKFLAYCESMQEKTKWRDCQSFFGGEENPNGLLYRLKEWVNNDNEKEQLQEYCKKLNHGQEICIRNQKYNVAEDFVWQILGDEVIDSPLYKDMSCCLELSGPNLPPKEHGEINHWNIPVVHKYRNILKTMKQLIENDLAEMEYEDDESENDKNKKSYQKRLETILKKGITDFFSQNRVLPRYGFPCDVIELLPNSKDYVQYRQDVELERDARQGLFEYAPGKQVVANKRGYVSSAPVSYIQGKNNDGKHRSVEELFVDKISYCRSCKTYFPKEYTQCPACGENKIEAKRACMPDAFIANESSKARSFSPIRKEKKDIFYPGKALNAKKVSHTQNCMVADSDIRSLWYINSDVKRNNTERRKKNTKKTMEYDVFMRDIRTDIALITSESSGINYLPQSGLQITQAMWDSALAAILKATEDILNVSYRDIGGIISTIDSKKYMVLYDRSTSGSGAILPLIPSDDENWNSSVYKHIRNILRRAIEICMGMRYPDEAPCNCCEVDDKKKKLPSASHIDWLKKNREGVREAKSCNKCLKSYENQSQHDRLDAYDAILLLKWLLGEDSLI